MSTVTLWGPRPVLSRRGFIDFDSAFDTLARRAFAPARPNRPGASFVPAAEIVREGDDAVVRVELPGVDAQKDLSVEIDGRQLVIKGERRDERSSESNGRTLHEVRYGRFSRSFALPEGVSGESVSATHDNGVLTVRVAGAYVQAAVPAAHRVEITTAAPVAIDSGETAAVAEPAEGSDEQN